MTELEPFAGGCAAGELFDFDDVKRPRRPDLTSTQAEIAAAVTALLTETKDEETR